jgi:hypothetical protein
MGKDEEIEIGVECLVLEVSFSFDVGGSMFDVRRSSFKTTLYGTNVTCECLQNKLALMGQRSHWALDGVLKLLLGRFNPYQFI